MKLKMFRVDDGAIHWIVAESKEQAIGIMIHHNEMAGNDWPTEKPSVEAMADTADFKYRIDSGDGKVVSLTVAEWLEFLNAPQYLACSEI